MNKRLWILVFLPLVAVLSAFLVHSQEHPSGKAASPDLSSKPMPQDATRNEFAPAARKSPSFTEETWKQVDESMKNHGMAMTPQLEEAMVDAKLKQIEARCAPLFKDWGLSSDVVRETLHVLKEKETNLRRARTQRLRAGVSQMGMGKEEKYIENALAENQLVKILGQSRYDQLAAMEKQVEAENIQRGLSLARSAQDD